MSQLWREAFVTFVKRLPIAAPTQEVYQPGAISSARRGLWVFGAVAAAVLVVVGLAVPDFARYSTYVALSILPVAVLLAWLTRTDRYEPEPKTLILAVVGIGVAVSAVVRLLHFPPGFIPYLIKLVLLEFIFLLILYLLDYNRVTGREFNDHLDGVVYGVSLGLGYVVYSNFYMLSGLVDVRPEYVLTLALEEFVYVMFPAFSGWWIGYVKAKHVSISFSDVFTGFVPVVLLKTVSALAVTFLSALTILPRVVGLAALGAVLLLLLMRRVTWALQDEVLWGYAAGKAPVEQKGR